jgi:hypothetical protein
MRSPKQEIERYLRTGEHDDLFTAWPGCGLPARAHRAYAELRHALVAAVKTRTADVTLPQQLHDLDAEALAYNKVQPMVGGLFPAIERQSVLEMLSRSLVFLTPATIEPVLLETRYLLTAWRLANTYLLSCGVRLLADDAPHIVGLSEGTTCYVSMSYFRPNSRFDDFVVHEAAHVFHNCKRRTVDLSETRRREWLLDIDFSRRETFAYACETYSRILELSDTPAARAALLKDVEIDAMPPTEQVDQQLYLDTLRAALAARNGWKRILRACAPKSRTTRVSALTNAGNPE